jgi:DNA-binding CsgD family transcriptional regulator
LIQQNDGITLRQDKIHLFLASQQTILNQYYRSSFIHTYTQPDKTTTLSIVRPSGQRPFHMVIFPLRNRHHFFSTDTATVVFVRNIDNTPTTPLEQIATLYGLTLAESRLAAALAQGHTLQDYADSIPLSIETVRSQLKSITGKLDVTKQSDVVRLLLMGIPSVVCPSTSTRY